MLNNLYGYDDKNDKEHDYYSFREHNDKKQYCPYCQDEREFIFDRCTTCNNQ